MLWQALSPLLVLLLLFGVLYFLRRKGLVQLSGKSAAGKPKLMQSVERLPLSGQHSLHLVRVADRLILVSVSPGGCSLLEGGSVPAVTCAAVNAATASGSCA